MTTGPRLLILRADADARIGSGHVMRCLALAQEWRHQGGEAVLAGAIGSETLKARLDSEGFALWEIPAPHPAPRDLATLLPRLREYRDRAGWIAADGYHFDPAYHQALRATGWPLMVIDDFCHLPTYHADILTNPNAYAHDLSYRAEGETLTLRGSRYALLRKEFRKAISRIDSNTQDDARSDCRRLLVTMGGSDPDNVTARVIDLLDAMDRQDLDVTIIAGPLNPHRQALEQRVRTARFTATLLPPVTDMTPLMREADLAICAAGSTCWELAGLGVPMVVTVLADNQERLAASLVSCGAALSLGWHHAWEPKEAAVLVENLVSAPGRLQAMRKQGRALVDGRGCERLALAMRGFHIAFRDAVADDCETIFRWANDPATRSASFSSQPISWAEHRAWFTDRLNDRDHIFFLAIADDGTPLGQARFVVNGNGDGVISVSLAPAFRGVGLGSRLIRLACGHALAKRPLRTIRALIKPDNTSSLHAFAQAGFRLLGPVETGGQQAVAMDYAPEGAAA